ncbi:MAG: arylsulfatase [Planctomycetaceae bacterium]|nr:arylsulfatase [Planctomycetaceae bacterium]
MWASVFGQPLPAAESRRPNVVILYADDMGWGDLGIQNPDSKIPTPHLDELAQQGTRFTDGHSSSGICTPSRYALLNGRYHWRKFHGIVNSFDESVMDADRLTIAEVLKDKGYRTACIGKWHLGWNWQAIKKPGAQLRKIDGGKPAYASDDFDWTKAIPDGPLAHGFDYYFGDDVPNFPPYTWIENDKVTLAPSVSLTTTAKTAEGSWEARPGPSAKDWDFWNVMPTLTKTAVRWIHEQSPEQPFFLYFPFTSPHAPIVPTKEFIGKSQANGYGDFVVQTDDTVGQVLKALKEKGFDQNTLVIFTADNGPERYAYDRIRNFEHRSMGPLRGLKRDIWEGGHRVPFLVRWPGVVAEGAVSDGLISQIDLHATIAGIVQHELPPGTAQDSYDQLALLKGGASARTTIIHNTKADHYAIRHEDWVLIQGKSGGVSAVPAWFDEQNGYAKNSLPGALYNLRTDQAQKNNLYSKHPEIVADLERRLTTLRNEPQVRR